MGDLKSRIAIIPEHGCIENLCARALPPSDHVNDSQLREECFPYNGFHHWYGMCRGVSGYG
jgi:hypothetical protein